MGFFLGIAVFLKGALVGFVAEVASFNDGEKDGTIGATDGLRTERTSSEWILSSGLP